eukprot:29717-Chlamydomonas_euryale.AAC.1
MKKNGTSVTLIHTSVHTGQYRPRPSGTSHTCRSAQLRMCAVRRAPYSRVRRRRTARGSRPPIDSRSAERPAVHARLTPPALAAPPAHPVVRCSRDIVGVGGSGGGGGERRLPSDVRSDELGEPARWRATARGVLPSSRSIGSGAGSSAVESSGAGGAWPPLTPARGVAAADRDGCGGQSPGCMPAATGAGALAGAGQLMLPPQLPRRSLASWPLAAALCCQGGG